MEKFQTTSRVPFEGFLYDFFPKDETLPKSFNPARVL